MPRQKSAHSAPARAPTAPRRSPRLSHATGGQAPHTTQLPTPTPLDNVATSSDESESDNSDDQRQARLVPRGRQQKPKRATTTTTTTQRVGTTLRRRTMRIEVPEGVSLADALARPSPQPAIADKLMELVTRMEASAERNELARVEERHDAQRLFRESMESNARQTQLVVTAFRETMASTFHDAIGAITRQNEGIASALRELLPRAHHEA